jgi:hypothetical protein
MIKSILPLRGAPIKKSFVIVYVSSDIRGHMPTIFSSSKKHRTCSLRSLLRCFHQSPIQTGSTYNIVLEILDSKSSQKGKKECNSSSERIILRESFLILSLPRRICRGAGRLFPAGHIAPCHRLVVLHGIDSRLVGQGCGRIFLSGQIF